MSVFAKEETLMLLKIAALDGEVFPDFTERNRKRYDLIIDRQVKLFFFLVVVPVWQIVELYLLLNRYFFLVKPYHIGLVDHELALS
jgi:hypothetical protein